MFVEMGAWNRPPFEPSMHAPQSQQARFPRPQGPPVNRPFFPNQPQQQLSQERFNQGMLPPSAQRGPLFLWLYISSWEHAEMIRC